MTLFFAEVFMLIVPLFFAGLCLVLVLKKNWLAFLDIPLDFEAKLNHKRIFGKNKTFRGVVCLLLGTTISGTALGNFFPVFTTQFPSLAQTSLTLTFFVMGMSYIGGELLNSFIKRRLEILPGKVIEPPLRAIQRFVDLSDGIVSSLIVGWLVFHFQLNVLVTAGVIGIGCHYLVERLMINLRLKSSL